MSQEHVSGIVPMWTIGDRLGKALAHADLAVGEMADYLGVSRNTVGNYINDRRKIPRPTLMLWAMRTGVPLEWLTDGEVGDQPQPPNPGKRDNSALAALIAEKSGRGTNAGYPRFQPELQPAA